MCPLNREALESKQVGREAVEDVNTDTEEVVAVDPACEVQLIQEDVLKNCQKSVEERNHWAVQTLITAGFNGGVFKKIAPAESESR